MVARANHGAPVGLPRCVRSHLGTDQVLEILLRGRVGALARATVVGEFPSSALSICRAGCASSSSFLRRESGTSRDCRPTMRETPKWASAAGWPVATAPQSKPSGAFESAALRKPSNEFPIVSVVLEGDVRADALIDHGDVAALLEEGRGQGHNLSLDGRLVLLESANVEAADQAQVLPELLAQLQVIDVCRPSPALFEDIREPGVCKCNIPDLAGVL